ncbi:MAG: putative sulfate exporter family transporter, partial [Gemmataceae bacterium]|nr:putative sulfate exporter family transporter [Gemmataceae bacterium]
MKTWLRSEDTLAVLLGLSVVGLSLSVLTGADLLGWAASTAVWVDPAKALAPAAKGYSWVSGPASLGLTYLFLLAVLTAGAAFLGRPTGRFAVRFTVLFALAFGCWVAGNNAYLAATPDKRAGFGIPWSAGLTGEAGYLVALLGGLAIGNFAPRAAVWLKPAALSELYIKTAIVILGAGLGAQAAEASGLAKAVMFRGLAAIIEAYLIYWAVVYYLARRVFGFSREWAAPLASGISICGVSAAITTGAAIRARPVVPVMVSSLVVVFSVVEMLVLPGLARTFLADDPMVAAAWMGLAVKTDGAAVSSGAITESLVYSQAAAAGHVYQPGWMVMTTTTVKVFIDLFIGVWALILSAIWAWKIDKRADTRLPLAEIWQRFPKFVFGYLLTFGVFLAVGLARPETVDVLKRGTAQGNVFRQLFFVLTFFSIGLAANLRRLWAEGLGRLALVYVVSLFGFVIWVGLAIS